MPCATQRIKWLKIAVVIALPIILFGIIVEHLSWQPRIIGGGGVLAFSPDGQVLAIGSGDEALGKGQVNLWDVSTGALQRTLVGHKDVVMSVAFAPDGQTLASGSRDGMAKLWNAQTGKLVHTLVGNADGVALAYSPDAKTLAVARAVGTPRIGLYDGKTGKLKLALPCPEPLVFAIAFSPDGKRLAIGASRGAMGKIILWNVQTGKVKRTLNGHRETVLCVAFSPDGQTLASGDENGTIHLWDLHAGKLLRILRGSSDTVDSLVFLFRGQTLASSSGNVQLWGVQSGKLLRTIASHGPIAISPDERLLAANGKKGVELWRIK